MHWLRGEDIGLGMNYYMFRDYLEKTRGHGTGSSLEWMLIEQLLSRLRDGQFLVPAIHSRLHWPLSMNDE